MAEQQVAPAPIVAPAPVAAPVAAEKGEYGGPKGESFAQALSRHGGLDPTSAQLAEPAPAPAPEPEPKAKGKGKKATAAKAESAEAAPAESPVVDKKTALLNLADELGLDDSKATLKALATKLGLDVDDAHVTAKERIEFREAKRKHHERMQAEEQDLVRRWNEAKSSIEPQLARTQRIDRAMEAGDYEGLAKELGAESWNGLQEKVLAALSDPNYKRLQELERQVQARERQEAETRQEMQRREESRARAAAMQTHKQNLSAAMAQSKDPLVAAMHDDPLFINTVIEVQRQNWDGSTTVMKWTHRRRRMQV